MKEGISGLSMSAPQMAFRPSFRGKKSSYPSKKGSVFSIRVNGDEVASTSVSPLKSDLNITSRGGGETTIHENKKQSMKYFFIFFFKLLYQ